jgi:general secretion pathway protein D
MAMASHVAFAQVRPGQTGTLAATQRAGLKGDALIQCDPETGSLVVVTDEKTNEQIKKVVEALDRPVPQVLIKVLFLEVTHTHDLDLGVEGLSHHKSTKGPIYDQHVDMQTIQTIFGIGSQTTGGFYHLVEKDLDATLRALAEVTKLEVLSRPSILTRNNQQAMITVGKKVPFIQNSRITQLGETINTVVYDDIGIILRVTPHISEDRVVSMDVTPEISTLTGETVPISNTVNAPVFAMRSAQTGVVVPDGKTVVIGGLMEDSKNKDAKKVPILGDIPLLGALFQNRSDQKSKTELLIFLTPHVVENAGELTTMTESEKNDAQLAPKVFGKDQMDHFIGTKPDKTVLTPPEPENAPDAQPETAPDAAPETPPAPAPEGTPESAPEAAADNASPQTVEPVPESSPSMEETKKAAQETGNRGRFVKPRH